MRVARQHQVKLRQTYVRVGKQALLKQSRYAAARRGRRAKQQTRRLRTYLGRVIRDVERKLQPMPDELLILEKFRLDLLRRVAIPVSMRRLKQHTSKFKPLPFNEEQIRLRACKLWQQRGQQGTPDENWQAARQRS